MKERAGLITMKGNPLTLIGKKLKVGETAPEFGALDNDLSPVTKSTKEHGDVFFCYALINAKQRRIK